MEPKSLLPRLPVPATCPYPEPARYSPYPYIPLPHIYIYIYNTYIYIHIDIYISYKNGWKRSYTVVETCHCVLHSKIKKFIAQVRPVFAPVSYKLTTTLTCSVKSLSNYPQCPPKLTEGNTVFCRTLADFCQTAQRDI
jgi:hypothetical protein